MLNLSSIVMNTRSSVRTNTPTEPLFFHESLLSDQHNCHIIHIRTGRSGLDQSADLL